MRPLLRSCLGVAGVAGLVLLTPAVAQAPEPLYPDLRALSPTHLVLSRATIDGSPHHVLRFTATFWNAGPGPLELRGETSTGRTLVYQRIYDQAGGFAELPVGEFTYHEAHDHWHFERFAEYEIWSRAAYEQWLAGGRQEGQPGWRGSKTTGQGESYCVRDSQLVEHSPSSPSTAVYGACDQEVQGISVGWGDTYDFQLPEQWIDLGEAKLPRGRYVLRVIVDPRHLLHESRDGADPDREGPSANEAITVFKVRGRRITAPLDPIPARVDQPVEVSP